MSAFKTMLFAGVAMGTMPATAWAEAAPSEEQQGTSDELVVIGQRQQYRGDVPVKEIPQSIQTIDATTLKNLGVTRLDDALDLTSGISKQNNFGGLWDAFAMRGFAGDENFPSGFLVNGFNGGRGYGGPRDASNIKRIEVLKGPNAAVFGRGEPGGTVNIITKKANLDGNFGSFTLSGGSFNNYRVEGDYNLVISDKLAVRMNGAVQDSDSFRDYVHTTKYVASPSVLLKLSDQTSISYEMEFVDLKVPFERGVVAVDGVLGLIPRSRFLDEPGNGPTHVKVLGHQVQFQQDLGGNDWAFLAGFGYRDTSFEGYSDDPELAGSRQILDDDGIHLARQRRHRDFSTTNTVLRAEVSGRIVTGPFTHHVILGADWDRFNINLYQTRYRPPVYIAGSPITADNNVIDIYNPVYGNLPTPNTTITNSLEKQKAYGIYAQDQIDITDKLKVRFGGRFDHFHQLIGSRQGAFAPTIDVLKKRFSPSAGALYEITRTLSIYGGYGTGFRPNSGQAAPDANGDRAPFAPETSKSYEVGLRYSSPMVSATLAAFTMKKNNILTSDPVNAGYSIAAGSARSKGIELDIDAKLPGDVNVMVSYAYTDAYWSSYPDSKVKITPGDPLINIPKHQANVIVSKDFDLGDAGKASIGGGVNYVSKRLGETATSFYLPDYTLARAFASYEPVDNIRIGVDVTNLFNVTWYASSYARYWVAPGAPRTITGRVTFSF
ncbi:MAG: TonB-dependent receptor [Novosphingobium sp.]